MLKTVPTAQQSPQEKNKSQWIAQRALKERDIAYKNLSAYLRDIRFEWVFDQDVRRGDTGALLLDLEMLALMFNGVRKCHYGKRMLEFAINRKSWWTPATEYLWLNNILVNLSGRSGKFMGLDKVNELVVQKIKDTHNPQGTPQAESFHLEVVGSNVFTFVHINKSVPRSFGKYGSLMFRSCCSLFLLLWFLISKQVRLTGDPSILVWTIERMQEL